MEHDHRHPFTHELTQDIRKKKHGMPGPVPWDFTQISPNLWGPILSRPQSISGGISGIRPVAMAPWQLRWIHPALIIHQFMGKKKTAHPCHEESIGITTLVTSPYFSIRSHGLQMSTAITSEVNLWFGWIFKGDFMTWKTSISWSVLIVRKIIFCR